MMVYSEKYEEDRDVMISNAKTVLNSYMQGNRIAKESGIHYQRIYDYRKGRRNIEKADKEILIKINRVFHTHAFFQINRKED